MQEALNALRKRLFTELRDIDELILYGSVARGESDGESDIDLLVITRRDFSRVERHRITDLVFDINLLYGTNFSTLVVDRRSWETGLFTVLPLHDEIIRDGIRL
ncbi:MAG: nucleotidyltransferase domain-containing protein [Pseudomonadota bacterium]